jgi:hypothetical protein
MKKTLLLLVLCLFLFGCAAARESGFYDHNAMYKDWDHLWFSWVGYKNVTTKDAKESKADRWWGATEEYRPAK